MSTTAVIFFSRDGSAKKAAALLADRLNADMVELKEQKASSFMGGAFRALRKKGRPLEGAPWEDCASGNVWILGTPLWASNGSPAMNTFLEHADFKGKEVYLFTMQADPGLKGSEDVTDFVRRKVEAGGGVFKDALALRGAPPGKTAEAEQFKDKVNRWALPV